MTSQEFEKKILDELKSDTGKDLNGWLKEISDKKFEKRKQTMDWLKQDCGLKHSVANVLVMIYHNDGKPVYQDAVSLKDDWFKNKDHLRPLYEQIEKAVLGIDREVTLTEKKLYMSFNGKREFAVASIKSKEIRVGMDLGDTPFDAYLQPAKSLGAMPRISHMVLVDSPGHIDDKLKKHLVQAYDHVHK
ncbi:DUF4287 domain-containing protein [candidate division KSB1 bacterium]|nr:DUF4287 domain-containing protein [candidate division KSB1 bacterium]